MNYELVKRLSDKKLEIATMESCTGGGLANYITSVEGASEILKFSAVTYSNEYKIRMGVSKETIDKYSVYSIEVAREMSRNILCFANADIGVGITGKINREDINNPRGKNNLVYVSIYLKEHNNYYDEVIEVTSKNRENNKNIIIKKIVSKLLEII